MKTIFFSEINFLNIFIMFFFRIIGFKIFFVKINNKLRNQFIIKCIKALGFEWHNYQTYEHQNFWSNIVIPPNNLANACSNKITDLVWNKNLESSLLEKQNLNICLHQRFRNSFESLCEVFAIAKHHVGNDKKIYLWLPNNLLSQEVIKEDKRAINLCPRSVTFLNNFFNYFFKFLYLYAIKKFYLFITQKYSKKIISKKNTNDFKVCFFPQGGIDNVNFKKNWFYSENKNDPFYPSNIIHFEWSKDDTGFLVNNNRTLAFYREKNIEFIFWKNLKSKINYLDYKIIFLLITILFSLFKKIDLSNILEICIILFQVKTNRKRLSNFANLKVALVGYASLFPQPLAVACRLNQIILVAAQERTMEPAIGTPYLLDKYFIVGEKSKKILENRKDKKMQLIETGLVKMKQNLEEGEEIKISLGNNFKLKCLVMAPHSVEDWYENGRSKGGSWRQCLSFYRNIFNLAKKNNEILFLIKSKNYLWLKVDFFNQIVDDFNNLKNIKILSDQKKWTPANCIKSSDFGITLYTSLADEMIASDKPVIIFEPEDFPSCLLDYGPTIISKNFDDINIKVSEIKSNLKLYNDKLNPVRNKFYKKFNKEYFFSQIQKLSLNF